MFDKETLEFFKNRFEGNLQGFEWSELQEQLLCRFLATHSRKLLSGSTDFVKDYLSESQVPERKIQEQCIDEKKLKDTLVVGDELGLIQHRCPAADFAFYSQEALEFAKRDQESNACLLQELEMQKNRYHRIVVLQLMTQLKEWKQVQHLGEIMKRLYGSLKKKGELVVVDKILYQDDFLIHLVSMDAEIPSIQKYGSSDFLMRARP